jgi:hypothetical protein
MHVKTSRGEEIFNNSQSPGIRRSHRWTAQEVAGNGEGVGHCREISIPQQLVDAGFGPGALINPLDDHGTGG